jgi:hypothetical protein
MKPAELIARINECQSIDEVEALIQNEKRKAVLNAATERIRVLSQDTPATSSDEDAPADASAQPTETTGNDKAASDLDQYDGPSKSVTIGLDPAAPVKKGGKSVVSAVERAETTDMYYLPDIPGAKGKICYRGREYSRAEVAADQSLMRELYQMGNRQIKKLAATAAKPHQ